MNKITSKANEDFVNELFEFLRARGITNLKVPHIGGKELNLLALYKAVIKRGGGEIVSNNKLWRDIVDEFDLPASCTSASFTLKTHYQKYLLMYEQKHYFNRKDEDMVTDLGTQRQKRPKPNNAGYLQKRQDMSTTIKYEHTRHNPKNSKYSFNNEKSINKDHQNHETKQMVPFLSEMKRIIVAFESNIVSEVRYALNRLSTYSSTEENPFYLENYKVMFDEFKNYFIFLYKRLENTKCISKPKEDPRNDEKQEKVKIDYYDPHEYSVPPSEFLDQLKLCLQITKNLLTIKANELFLAKEGKLKAMLMDLLLYNKESEVNKLTLEVIAGFSKYTIFSLVDNTRDKLFIQKLVNSINSEKSNEYEPAVENIRNLLLNQENEAILEQHLPLFVERLVNFLLDNSFDFIEKVLDIINVFAGMKMPIRLLLVKQTYLFTRLIALLAGNFERNNDRIGRACISILNKLMMNVTTRSHLKFYENDLFFIADSSELL